MSSILAFEVGDRVLIESGPAEGNSDLSNERSGTIRYLGKTDFREGDWVGIELDSPDGKNDGSVGGVRYFTCQQFHGLFVPPNKVRLNLSGSEAVPTTPNHIEKIENFQMDFSATGSLESVPFGLKTPTSNVKSQFNTPATADLKTKQSDLDSLKEQISSVRAELEFATPSKFASNNQGAVNGIVTKLADMLNSYEKVASEYESLLKQSIMSKKASKLDGSIVRLEDEINLLSRDKSQLLEELEQTRTNLYHEVQLKEQLKERIESSDSSLKQFQQRLQSEERSRLALEEENQRLKFDNTRVKTELDVEHTMEEEQRRRHLEHENQLRELKSRFETELHQKKLQIADLQNEVALLKQTEKILEEELQSRSSRNAHIQDESELHKENRQLTEQVSQFRRQAEEYRKKYEDMTASKQRAEDSYRKELEAFKQLRLETTSHESDDLRNQYENKLSELIEKLKKNRLENEELNGKLEESRKQTEKLTSSVVELEARLQEKERKVAGLSEHIHELERRVFDESTNKNREEECKRLSELLAQARSKLAEPNEQVSNLRRKIALIEREKELLEEQLRDSRLSFYSQGELQTFSGFIQSLKRHIDAEILSLEPMKMTLSDVVRAKEIVDILMKVTDDVRIKVLTHLGQVEDVIKQRQPLSKPTITDYAPDTVKIERVRNLDLNEVDFRKRLDFHSANDAPMVPANSSRYLREPLGVVNTSIFSKSLDVERRNNPSTSKPTASLVTANLNQPISGYLRSLPPQQAFDVRPPIDSQSARQILKVHEPSRCNLCHEYGHDSLSCTDYLSGTEGDDVVLNDLRSNIGMNRSGRFYNVSTRS